MIAVLMRIPAPTAIIKIPAQPSSRAPNSLRGTLAVHDPFAGTGERPGALCDRLGLSCTGTEIEAPFILDARVRAGDSTEAATYLRQPATAPSTPTSESEAPAD